MEALGLDQIDLLLIHWPSPGDKVPFEHYMLALAEAQSRGWARQIGVSNFPVRLLEKARLLLGDAARGLFTLPALNKMDDRKNLILRDVRQVGNDMRVIARVK